MHEGVSRDGSHLYPAFPYDHFTKLTDADVAALYADHDPPARAVARPRQRPPLPIEHARAAGLLEAAVLLAPAGSSRCRGATPNGNRGAYLVEGLSHCGACHTPRNLLGAERHDQAFAGAVIDNWVAPPLTRANPSPVPWGVDDLHAYLATAISRFHGTAAGPMSPVVHDGLARLPDADVRAIALYIVDIAGGDARDALEATT